MSEHLPQPPTPEQHQVNSYGTDDPGKQARIEAARTAAAEERRGNREKLLERYVGYGVTPEDAQALIEYEDTVAMLRESAETGETGKATPPRIYVRSLVDHAEGHDIGGWIDASQDLEDIHADIRTILSRSLHAHRTGQPAEVWAIHDQAGFGAIRLGEYESLDMVCSLGKGIAEHGLAFAAWAELSPQRNIYTLERFTDAYLGDYPSAEAYAQRVVEERGGDEELAQLPDWLQRIMRFDWQAMLQHMEQDDEIQIVYHPGGLWVFNGRV